MDYVIVVAGGKGLRMGGDVPKQFLPLAGRPVLMHTLERFRAYSEQLGIILVLPHEQQAYWYELCEQHQFRVNHTVVDGGETRYHSSMNGLTAIPDDEEGVVGIHDGVRPFVSVEVIDRCFETARDEYACIPVMPVTDTLRYIDQHGGGKNVNRADYRIVQTPQVFDIQLLKHAFALTSQTTADPATAFTDDASVVESMGCQVHMVQGNRENIKLTTPFDLQLAEWLVRG
jgi:2-C-methyl-D-erythritol 4-phosphate cytidylyltransferase